MSSSLNVVLSNSGIKDSANLYTPAGGYLRYHADEKKWTLSKQPLSNKEFTQQSLIISEQLCREGLFVRDPESLISRINEVFTEKNLYLINSQQPGQNEIRFNSRVRGYEYLSNFFPTLIVDSRGRVYPSAEAYYQIQKVYKLSNNDNPIEIPFDVEMNALKCKRLAENLLDQWIVEHPSKVESVNEMRLKLMEWVIVRKFEQNPVLKRLLVQTYPNKLTEHSTTDNFFGSSAEGVGENHLGNILMRLRTVYREPRQ